jgi:methionyl-tRNA formyltransferase
MGTPEFASTILKHLVENGQNIVGVVTVPDKPAGRGQKLQSSAVKEYALTQNLTILQPEKLKDEVFLTELSDLNADLFVVVAFRMLPEVVWSMPPLGTINLHGSLLPNYRGAAPINRAVMNGETVTGVTTFFIEKDIDTGAIILQETLDIKENETAGELHDRMMHLGAKVTLETVNQIFEKKTQPKPQTDFDLTSIKPAHKLFKQDCQINWNQSAKTIHDFIRGLSPYPTAWTIWQENGNKSIKIFKTIISSITLNAPVGQVVVIDKKILVQCQNSAIELLELQLEGKKRVTAKEFLNGNAHIDKAELV